MLFQALKKTKIAFLATVVAFPFCANAQEAQNGVAYPNLVPPQVNAQTYILMDYNSGTILAALNPDQRQYPASLTKMMTSYVVGDAIKQGKIKPTDMVNITENSYANAKQFHGSSKMFLDINTQASVSDLNRGIIVVSGNDACVAMAEHVAGTTDQFVALMNKYVQQFGLKNTNFTTPHGLDDPNQYSSARDMAIIGSHIIRDLPEEYKIYSEKDFTYNKIKQPNRNGLLWDKTMNVDGMKTGHTDQAGYNLVASATNPNNMRLISVVMGVDTKKGREVESKKLLQWGFSNFDTFKTLEANKAVKNESVYYGDEGDVAVGVLQDGFITVPKGRQADLKARIEMNQKYLEAPLAKGQIVGKVVYSLDGKDVASVNLQAMQDVGEASFIGKGWDWLVLTVKGLFD